MVVSLVQKILVKKNCIFFSRRNTKFKEVKMCTCGTDICSECQESLERFNGGYLVEEDEFYPEEDVEDFSSYEESMY